MVKRGHLVLRTFLCGCSATPFGGKTKRTKFGLCTPIEMALRARCCGRIFSLIIHPPAARSTPRAVAQQLHQQTHHPSGAPRPPAPPIAESAPAAPPRTTASARPAFSPLYGDVWVGGSSGPQADAPSGGRWGAAPLGLAAVERGATNRGGSSLRLVDHCVAVAARAAPI